MKKTALILSILTISIFNNSSLSFADSSSEKFTVFQEFFKITGVENQYKQAQNLLANQFARSLGGAIYQQIEQKAENITDEEKKELSIKVEKYMENAMAKLVLNFEKEIPFSELVENVYYPTYEKHYSVAELRKIIAFYQSPIGKKFVNLAPSLMQETMSTMNSQYEKKIIEISQRVMKEELSTIKIQFERKSKK